jgi:hypothetical protein
LVPYRGTRYHLNEWIQSGLQYAFFLLTHTAFNL